MATEPGQTDRPHPAELAVCLERLGERVDEAFLGERIEPVLPPEPENAKQLRLAVDPWLDPADEPVAEPDRQHVVAPAPFRGRDVDLPDVVEAEQRTQQLAIPDERVERREERDARRPAARCPTRRDLELGLMH